VTPRELNTAADQEEQRAERSVAAAQRLLDIRSVAKHFAVSPFAVRKWIKDGHIQAVRLPGGKKRVHYRVPASEIQRLEARRAE
jgi:transposase